MRHMILLLIVPLAMGCGKSTRPDTLPASSTLSVAEHNKEVGRHEGEVKAHERQYNPEANDPDAPRYQCADTPLAGIVYSGNEPLRVMRPCWTADTNPTAWHLAEVARHKKYAAQHRQRAGELLRAEREACAGLGEQAISLSPLFYREDIVRVTPYYERKRLYGARVVFRKVPGLTQQWLNKALFCHQARAAAMGYTSTFHPYCPASLDGVSVSATESSDEITVTFRSTRGEIAAAVLGRAERLQHQTRK